MPTPNPSARKIIYGLVLLLAVLHHDFWFWDDPTLVLGFMPVGLLYHALYSIAAACLWAAAVKWAWPTDVEAFAEADESAPPRPDAAGNEPAGDASGQ